MTQIFGSCNRYVQGYGELEKMHHHVDWMGTRFFVVGSPRRLASLKETIQKAMMEAEDLVFEEFGGECSWAEVDRLIQMVKDSGSQAIIGVGGGKVADTVKVVAHQCGIRVVIVPTIAASDASTSAASLLYREDGTIEEVLNFPESPDLVLVDTRVILYSPVRLTVAGMGDALSTYIGGKVCYDHYYDNHFGAKGTHTALAIAKLSYDMLMQYGRQAKKAAEQQVITHAFNAVIEVNILMSGLGFENNGSSIDHSFFFGTLALPDREEQVYHGEGVAFSTCCQMVMNGASNEELDEVFQFCVDVGLPVTLEDMGLTDLTEEEYHIMAEAVLQEVFTQNSPSEVTFEMVLGAYKTADAIGKMYKSGGKLI